MVIIMDWYKRKKLEIWVESLLNPSGSNYMSDQAESWLNWTRSSTKNAKAWFTYYSNIFWLNPSLLKAVLTLI